MKRLLIALVAVFITSVGAQAQILLQGDIWYSIYGKRFHLEADALSNYYNVQTDRLRFRVFASEHQWSQYNPGHLIAYGGLPRLKAGQTRFDIHSTVHMDYPHSDWYHITLTVEQRYLDLYGKYRWEIMDLIFFDHEIFLHNPHDWWHPFPFW